MHKIMERTESNETVLKLIDEMKSKGYDIHAERIAELKTYSPTMSVYVIDILKK
jgi:tRNA (guanine37-N1)-methyltransferase